MKKTFGELRASRVCAETYGKRRSGRRLPRSTGRRRRMTRSREFRHGAVVGAFRWYRRFGNRLMSGGFRESTGESGIFHDRLLSCEIRNEIRRHFGKDAKFAHLMDYVELHDGRDLH